MQLDTQVFERLKAIEWFSNCLQPTVNTLDLDMPFNLVTNWDEVEASLTSAEWENTNLQARNRLTSFLSKKHPSVYSNWNKMIREAKPSIEAIVASTAKEFAAKHNLGQRFVDFVLWDTLAATMEISLKSLNPPKFYERLLIVYGHGRMPCGWRGEWPNGQLLVA